MRVVIIGAGDVPVQTARLLVERGVEVVIVEQDKERIEELSEDLDCAFLHGDGSRPRILQEAGPETADILICMGPNDQTNIIASLVGRSLGFARVVTSIQDTAYEQICLELGLGDTIIPARTISRYLADMCHGVDVMELSSLIKGEARLFTFQARGDDVGEIGSLELPGDSRVICFYRGDEKFYIAHEGERLKKDDQVVVLTRSGHLKALRDRWEPRQAQEEDEEEERRDEGG